MVADPVAPKDGGVARKAGGSPARAGKSSSRSGRLSPPRPLLADLSEDGGTGVEAGAAQSKLGGGGGGGGAPAPGRFVALFLGDCALKGGVGPPNKSCGGVGAGTGAGFEAVFDTGGSDASRV